MSNKDNNFSCYNDSYFKILNNNNNNKPGFIQNTYFFRESKGKIVFHLNSF